MNHYAWKATNGKSGKVYALDDEEAKIKVETLFDVVVEDMELLEENVSRDRIKGRQLKKGDKLRRISDGKLFTYFSKDDSGDENYIHVEEMAVPVKLSDFEKIEPK